MTELALGIEYIARLTVVAILYVPAGKKLVYIRALVTYWLADLTPYFCSIVRMCV